MGGLLCHSYLIVIIFHIVIYIIMDISCQPGELYPHMKGVLVHSISFAGVSVIMHLKYVPYALFLMSAFDSGWFCLESTL